MNTRRKFFRQLCGETISQVDEIRGKPQLRLCELDQVPDHILREMIPVLNPSSLYRIRDDRILVKNRHSGNWEEFYRLDPSKTFIFSCFNGQHTLDDIAYKLEKRFNHNKETAFNCVKTLFIASARHFICYPDQPHE